MEVGIAMQKKTTRARSLNGRKNLDFSVLLDKYARTT